MEIIKSGVLLFFVALCVTVSGCYSQLGALEGEKATSQNYQNQLAKGITVEGVTNSVKSNETAQISNAIGLPSMTDPGIYSLADNSMSVCAQNGCRARFISRDRREFLYEKNIGTYYGLLYTSIDQYDPSKGPIYLYYSIYNQDEWLDELTNYGFDEIRKKASGSWIEPIDNSERLAQGQSKSSIDGSQTYLGTISDDNHNVIRSRTQSSGQKRTALSKSDVSDRVTVLRHRPISIDRSSKQIERAHQTILENRVYSVDRPVRTESEVRRIQERNFMILSRVIEKQGGQLNHGYPVYFGNSDNRLTVGNRSIYSGSERTRSHTSVRSRSTGTGTGKTITRTRSGSDGSSGSRSRSSSSNNKRSSGSVDKNDN